MGFRTRDQRQIDLISINMSIYMVLNSDKHSNYFPQNKPYNFKAHLLRPMNLEGNWMVSLVDFKTGTSALFHEDVYMYCDMCGDSIIDGSMHPLLRRFLCSGNKGDFSSTFPDKQYKPVSKTYIEDIHIYLKDVAGKDASFLNQPVSITLHLKSYPFWTDS